MWLNRGKSSINLNQGYDFCCCVEVAEAVGEGREDGHELGGDADPAAGVPASSRKGKSGL